MIGPRTATVGFDFGVCRGDKVQENIRIVAADSTKPDLNDGEVGRSHYGWIEQNFPDPGDFKLFVPTTKTTVEVVGRSGSLD